MAKRKKTTKDLGGEFELLFGEFMKSELGYDKVKKNTYVGNISSELGSEADLIGIELDNRGRFFKAGAYILILLCGLVMLIIGICGIIYPDTELSWMLLPAMFFFSGIVYAIIGKKLDDKYTMVECKGWTSKKASTDEIEKLVRRVGNYNSLSRKKHPIHKMVYVCRNGFTRTGQQYAEIHSVTCYHYNEKAKKFEKTTLYI